MARLDRIAVNLGQGRRKPFSFNVMARLDRATRRDTVPRRMARSSRAMTAGERPAHQNLLRHRLKLTPVRLDLATRRGTVPLRVARSSWAMTDRQRSADSINFGCRHSVARQRHCPAHECERNSHDGRSPCQIRHWPRPPGIRSVIIRTCGHLTNCRTHFALQGGGSLAMRRINALDSRQPFDRPVHPSKSADCPDLLTGGMRFCQITIRRSKSRPWRQARRHRAPETRLPTGIPSPPPSGKPSSTCSCSRRATPRSARYPRRNRPVSAPPPRIRGPGGTRGSPLSPPSRPGQPGSATKTRGDRWP